MLRKLHAFWLVAVLAMLAGGLVTAAPALAAAKATENGYLGSAYGSLVQVGSTVRSGRSALATLGCTASVGVTHTNTAASADAAPLLNTGTIDTSVASEATSTGVATTSSTTIQSVSVLGGLVSATGVKSVSTTSRNTQTGAYSTSAAGTQFATLSIAGLPVSVTPAPNTKINLLGVGYVVLNQQTSTIGDQHAALRVIALHVYVTLSTPLAPIGTQITVSLASSGLGGPAVGLLDGLAYGAHANVANTIIAGNLFPESLSCLGTNGSTKTNSGVALEIPGILSSGTVTDTVEGTASHKQASATVSSTIEGLNLLAGTVEATAIHADVTATGNPPAYTDSSDFLGLTVAGFPVIGDNVAPNTKLTLAGIGTLWLHRQIKYAHKIVVIMVQVIVTVPSNPLGLSLGTTINVGYAQAGIA
jgi:hypothetical protein